MSDIDMERVKQQVERNHEIADEIRKADPSIPLITSIIMAGDRASAERSWNLMSTGEWTFERALSLTGSYARMDFMMRAIEEGIVNIEDVYSQLPEIWPYADPDDTDPRFLALWKAAWVANGNRYLRDGNALPRSATLHVYRGQMEDAPLGISWTLSKKVAERFARGAGMRVRNMGGIIYEADVQRRTVLAYLTRRREKEVIIDPRGLQK